MKTAGIPTILNRPATWLLAVATLTLFALTACNSGGGTNPTPDAGVCTEAYSGPAYDSLHVPVCVLADSGQTLFEGSCTGCHNMGGVGSPGGVPPLANSDFFMNNKHKTIIAVLNGLSDSIYVNGMSYHGEMPSWKDVFTNREVASILTYLRVMLNDSTVTSCNPAQTNDDGFVVCQKTPRTAAARLADTVSVWDVKVVRDSLNAVPAL